MNGDELHNPQQQQPTNLPAVGEYHDAIIRAAQMPDLDVDKLERLISLQEAAILRRADLNFNEKLSIAESEMETISRDAVNPETKSKYATFARLDGAIRPIYTKHGFGVQFNTEPTGEANSIMVVGLLTNGPVVRRYQVPMPIVTTGFKGTVMMTRTHATLSAITYGKRTLLTMMFNLATEDDSSAGAGKGKDGWKAPDKQVKEPPYETHPETGEVILTPQELKRGKDQPWRDWCEEFMACIRAPETDLEAIDVWVEKNQTTITALMRDAPKMHANFAAAIGRQRVALLEGEDDEPKTEQTPDTATGSKTDTASGVTDGSQSSSR